MSSDRNGNMEPTDRRRFQPIPELGQLSCIEKPPLRTPSVAPYRFRKIMRISWQDAHFARKLQYAPHMRESLDGDRKSRRAASCPKGPLARFRDPCDPCARANHDATS